MGENRMGNQYVKLKGGGAESFAPPHKVPLGDHVTDNHRESYPARRGLLRVSRSSTDR